MITPRAQPGYYPGFQTLSQQAFWDAATRCVVLARLEPPPPFRFFREHESALLELICAHVLPQDDRLPERRIPLAPYIDERLHTGRIAGYRFEEMPPDGEAHRLGLKALDLMATELEGMPFRQLSWHAQEVLLQTVHDAEPPGAAELWKRLPVHRYWALLVSDCVEVYYAHPWSWDEIGFGGPAYPRAYTRLEGGAPEPWEVREQRYAWTAPEETISDRPQQTAAHRHQPAQGQGGTH